MNSSYIMNVDAASLTYSPMCDRRGGRVKWDRPHFIHASLIFRWEPAVRREMVHAAFVTDDRGLIGGAKPCRCLRHHGEHRLQIEGRAADDLQYVAGCGLIFQRLLQIAGAL